MELYHISKFMEQHHYVFHNNPTAVAGKVEMECRVEAYQFSKFTEQHHYVFHYSPTVVAGKVEAECLVED